MTNRPILSFALVFFTLFIFTTAMAGAASYQYDDLHRLIRMEQQDGTVIVYNYDNTGNRTSKVATAADSDNDGLPDNIENNYCTDPNDADTDDDGISDGDEDINHDGVWDADETDPCDIDTDGDGIQDGTELGITDPVPDPDGSGPLLGTDTAIFQPDLDPLTTTNPLLEDTDGDGLTDGEEDPNFNGRIDAGEYDPNVPAPVITAMIPNSGILGAEISIEGTNFGATQGSSYVTFYDDVDAGDITLWSDPEITCLVPAGAQSGCVTVSTIGGQSNCSVFTIYGDELAVDFGADGLWRYDGSWTKIANLNAGGAGLAGWRDGLAVDFDASGVWNYDGSAWTTLSGLDPDDDLAGWSGGLGVDFDADGLWSYNGSSWSRITTWDVGSGGLTGWNGGLVVDFDADGLWNYNGSSWSRITTWDVGSGGLTGWDGGLVVDFDTNGLWSYDGSSWTKLSSWDPEVDLTDWPGGLAADFGANGLWSYDGSAWTKLSSWDPGVMAGFADGLAVDFNANGLWNYDESSWTKLTNLDAEDIDDVDLN